MWSEASYRNAGISRYTSNLLEALFKHTEHEFLVFTNDEYTPPERWQQLKHVQWFTHGQSKPGQTSNVRGRRVLWEFFQAAKIAKANRCDVWFGTGHLIPLQKGVPRVAMIHDLIPILFPKFFEWDHAAFLKFALRTATLRSEQVLTSCEATKADIVRVFRVPPSKVSVAELGPGNVIQRVTPDPARVKALGIPFDRYLFALGTLEPRKNLPSLFEALAQLKDQPDLGIAVAGGNGWKESAIFERLKELGIADRVVFLGYVDDADLPLLFAGCTAYVYPSLYEGYGLTVLEGMLAGVPVLTSDRPSMKEVGQDAPWYFDPERPTDIARAISECLNASDRAKRIEKGLCRAHELTWERCANLTLEALAIAAAKK
jgi:glycosyltransferase involved in cell wall biosynthesis